jgi:hypothetical protein
MVACFLLRTSNACVTAILPGTRYSMQNTRWSPSPPDMQNIETWYLYSLPIFFISTSRHQCPVPTTTSLVISPTIEVDQVVLTRYPLIFSHSIFCLVIGNCLLNALNAPSLRLPNALFRSSWYFRSIIAICFATSEALADEDKETEIGLSVRRRTLPSS